MIALAVTGFEAGAYETYSDYARPHRILLGFHGAFTPTPTLRLGTQAGTTLREFTKAWWASTAISPQRHAGMPLRSIEGPGRDSGGGPHLLPRLPRAGRARRAQKGKVTASGLRQHLATTQDFASAEAATPTRTTALFMTAGEDVLPPYYANPGSGHPSIPDDPCNPPPRFPEDFASEVTPDTAGLDNDGDVMYDAAGSGLYADSLLRRPTPTADTDADSLGDADTHAGCNAHGDDRPPRRRASVTPTRHAATPSAARDTHAGSLGDAGTRRRPRWTKGQRACVNEMNKNGHRVNRPDQGERGVSEGLPEWEARR